MECAPPGSPLNHSHPYFGGYSKGGCAPQVRLVSHQPAPFVLVHACMVLKPTPRCSTGAHIAAKSGENLQSCGELFVLAFLRLPAYPEPSQDPEPSQGRGRMGVALPGAARASATHTVAAGCADSSNWVELRRSGSAGRDGSLDQQPLF